MESKIEFSVNHALIGVFTLGILVGFAGGTVTSLDSNNADNQEDKQNIELSPDNEPMLGNEDANVTIYMFEDFECPFCQRFEQNAYKDIVSDYVETGKARIVWKDYPLPPRIHPWAGPAAANMECVYRQDEEAFWTIKNKIFANQNSITTENVENTIVQWASEEGLNGEEIRSCAAQEDVKNEINSDMKEGGQLGTPTVFISKTGETEYTKISGAQPYSVFQNAIEEKLG